MVNSMLQMLLKPLVTVSRIAGGEEELEVGIFESDHFGRCFSYIGFGGSGKSSSRVEAKEPVAEASGPMYCGL